MCYSHPAAMSNWAGLTVHDKMIIDDYSLVVFLCQVSISSSVPGYLQVQKKMFISFTLENVLLAMSCSTTILNLATTL